MLFSSMLLLTLLCFLFDGFPFRLLSWPLATSTDVMEALLIVHPWQGNKILVKTFLGGLELNVILDMCAAV